MNAESRKILLAAARSIADYLGDDFVGRIEINIHRKGVGSINVLESLRPSIAEGEK